MRILSRWSLQDKIVTASLLFIVVVGAIGFAFDARQHARSEMDRALLHELQAKGQRLTQTALDTRGRLYRCTLEFQMDATHVSTVQRSEINRQAHEAGLPDKCELQR